MKQGRKRPLDTPKRMIERREREGEKEGERQKERQREREREREREKEKELKGIERERLKGRVKSSQNLPNREIKRKQRLITQY